MHPAIVKRRNQLIAEGKDPGAFYKDGDYSYPIGTHIIVAPTEFGEFKVDTSLYPAVDSAWFYPDGGNLWRFL